MRTIALRSSSRGYVRTTFNRPQLRFRSSGNMSATPAASTPGSAFTLAQNFLKDRVTFNTITSIVIANREGGGVTWLEAEIDIEDAKKAAQQKPGSDKENTSWSD